MPATERTAAHHEVLGNDRHRTTFDVADACDDTVAREALLFKTEAADIVIDVHSRFLERTCIDNLIDAFACGEEPFCVAGFELVRTGA